MVLLKKHGTKMMRTLLLCSAALSVISAPAVMLSSAAWAVEGQSSRPSSANNLTIPLNRSTLVELSQPMTEIVVANPDIADVHVHNAKTLSVMGKALGNTNFRIIDNKGNIVREFEITVSYDLPAIRRALKHFLPNENIGVDIVNTSIALTGQISSAEAADRALTIVKDFVSTSSSTRNTRTAATSPGAQAPANGSNQGARQEGDIINMMRVTSGQQVMLRVRVGEINRTALKRLGVDWNFISKPGASGLIRFGTGGGITGLIAGNPAGTVTIPTSNTRGVLGAGWTFGGGHSVNSAISALEQDGLFKTLAEPNLVAVSGEEADFLAGGEIAVPIVSGTGGTASTGVQYRQFGVAVKFTPIVLSENRIRMSVQPEVSELSTEGSTVINGNNVSGIATRRVRTTVELAPGESFMLAGLLRDNSRSTIEQIPGAKELPVLGALFRSTSFQRSETELVISVTPYIVDPVKGGDIRMPTDNFIPSTQMDMFFFGALSGNRVSASQSSPTEGAIGFLVD